MDPEKRGKRIGLEDIFIWLVVLLGVILLINIVVTFSLNNEIKRSAEAAKEKLNPAKIELTVIENPGCNDCFDVSTVVSYLKSAGIDVTKESAFDFDSKEGRAIISRYNIEKVPAVVATGEIDKLDIQALEKKDDALVFSSPEPPYTDAATGKIEGRVALYYLKDLSCEKCNDLTLLAGQIKGAGIKISAEENIDPGGDEGKDLIEKYDIGFVPTIILSRDAGVYSIMQEAWPQIGSKESDGSYVLRVVNPPFINLTTGRLRGIVDMTYITDKSCAECYNVSMHKEVIANPQSFGVSLDREETFDAGDAKGKELIAKYNITQVPAVILSDEIGVYPSTQALKQFFSVEKDGSYVFRKPQVLGAYRDLASNQIVKAPESSQGQ